jgi:hypothetical protein
VDEDPGQDWPRVVTRGGAGNASNRVNERWRFQSHTGCGRLRQPWEVLAAKRAQAEHRVAARDLNVLALATVAEGNGPTWEGADYVQEKASGKEDITWFLNRGGHTQAQTDLHVGGAQLDAVGVRHEMDTRQRLNGAAGAGNASGRLEVAEKRLGCE